MRTESEWGENRVKAKRRGKKSEQKRKQNQYTINVKPNENKYIFYSLLSAIALYLQFDVLCVCVFGY